jgi:hypothetical protein
MIFKDTQHSIFGWVFFFFSSDKRLETTKTSTKKGLVKNSWCSHTIGYNAAIKRMQQPSM